MCKVDWIILLQTTRGVCWTFFILGRRLLACFIFYLLRKVLAGNMKWFVHSNSKLSDLPSGVFISSEIFSYVSFVFAAWPTEIKENCHCVVKQRSKSRKITSNLLDYTRSWKTSLSLITYVSQHSRSLSYLIYAMNLSFCLYQYTVTLISDGRKFHVHVPCKMSVLSLGRSRTFRPLFRLCQNIVTLLYPPFYCSQHPADTILLAEVQIDHLHVGLDV